MKDEKNNKQPGTINVWGLANIGCTMENVTFQTLVQGGDNEKAQEAEVVEDANDAPKTKQPERPKPQPAVQETFADRVKAIIRKAASKNGQRIESNARGNAGAYIYNIDADCFCLAMDDMVSMHGEKLEAFLGGTMNCVQVTKVCFFIGQVIGRHVINDSQLQLADMFFAFEDYYTKSTVQTKLSIKSCTDEEKVLLGTFEGLLRKHKD